MHELGIVVHVAKTLTELAEENNLERIGSVTLEVGEVSGIITDYFVDCWNYFKVRYPLLKECEMKLEIIKGINYCTECQHEYEAIRYGRICPKCHSERTYLKQGNECNIKQIEAED